MAFFDTAWYVNFGNGSTTGYYAVPVWPGTGQSVSAGTWCRQLTTPSVGNERCFVCIVAGTTSAVAEPTWVVTRGADTGALVDGTVTWQECTGMAGPCGDLTNCPVWAASTGFTKGSVIYDSTSGSLQILSAASGNTGGSKPTFSATAGVTTNDTTSSNQWTSLGPTSNYTTAFKYPHARLNNAEATNWGAAGNSFALASNHAETQAASLTLTSNGTPASPCAIYCISNTTTLTSPTLATTGSISTTGANNLSLGNLSQYYYGINFNCGSGNNSVTFSLPSVNCASYFEFCSFNIVSTNTGSSYNIGNPANGNYGYCEYYNCTFTFSSTSQSISGNQGALFNMKGGSMAASGSIPTTLYSPQAGRSCYLTMRDVDLSAITGTLVAYNNSVGTILLENCKLGSGVTVTSGGQLGPGGFSVSLNNCDSTSTNYRYYYQTYDGTVIQETTVVRTGGATDGTTPISWNITSTANSKFLQPFVSEEIEQWNDTTGSSITATIYLTTNTTLNNNDFWVEFEYAGTSSFPLGVLSTTRMTPLATPTALTSDSSTWGGSVTNKYLCSATITPQNKGPVKCRLYLAKPSVTVYVDPKIILSSETSSKQYFVPGWGYVNELSTGGGASMLVNPGMTGGVRG